MTQTLILANLITMGLNLAYAIISMIVGIWAIKAIDRYMFPEINFTEEVKKGNIAAAIVVSTGILFLALILSKAVR